MDLKHEIALILNKVQKTKANHQKNIKVLNQLYLKEKTGFVEVFKYCIKCLLIFEKNIYQERVLDFLATFVAEVTPLDEEVDNEDLTDNFLYYFLNTIITEILQHHNNNDNTIRYNVCSLISRILQKLDINKSIDNDSYEKIQEAMLERAYDRNLNIRLLAIDALTKLQDLQSPNCPIINCYLSLIYDEKSKIRKEVVKCIAPSVKTIPHFIQKLIDVDMDVRIAAYKKCALLSPQNFKIIQRHQILKFGLAETTPAVRTVFLENLLPTWLNAYDKNYILFLQALQLDANENDINDTANISRDVITILLQSKVSVDDIIPHLSLTEEKVISVDKLTSETSTLWNSLVKFLRENDENDEHIDQILPELTPFCTYLRSIINKFKTQGKEEWQILNQHYILNNLLNIVAGYDLADEIGRKSLYELTIEILRTEHIGMNLKKQIMELAKKSSQKSIAEFTHVICGIISDINEPLVEEPDQLSPDERLNRECNIAELRVKKIRFESELEDAISNKEYSKASELHKVIQKLENELNELEKEPTVQMVKTIKRNANSTCDSLDLLILLLQLPDITTMTPSLLCVKTELVIPNLTSNNINVHWRTLKCLALLCFCDHNMVEEFIEILCAPILIYRTNPNYNKPTLIVAVSAVCDFISIIGPNLNKSVKDVFQSSKLHKMINYNTRKLYNNDLDKTTITKDCNFEVILEMILDMLDDGDPEIRDIALQGIVKLAIKNIIASELFITRLILKWYNPIDESDQLKIGIFIGDYVKVSVKNREILAKAIIPVLKEIAKSQKICDDVNKLVLFLTTISTNGNEDGPNTHMHIAKMCMEELIKTKDTILASYIIKTLTCLEINFKNKTLIQTIIEQLNSILEADLFNRMCQRTMQKIKQHLQELLERQDFNTTLAIDESNKGEETTTTNTQIINLNDDELTLSQKENDSINIPNHFDIPLKKKNGNISKFNNVSKDKYKQLQINLVPLDKNLCSTADTENTLNTSDPEDDNNLSTVTSNNKRKRDPASKHNTRSLEANDSNSDSPSQNSNDNINLSMVGGNNKRKEDLVSKHNTTRWSKANHSTISDSPGSNPVDNIDLSMARGKRKNDVNNINKSSQESINQYNTRTRSSKANGILSSDSPGANSDDNINLSIVRGKRKRDVNNMNISSQDSLDKQNTQSKSSKVNGIISSDSPSANSDDNINLSMLRGKRKRDLRKRDVNNMNISSQDFIDKQNTQSKSSKVNGLISSDSPSTNSDDNINLTKVKSKRIRGDNNTNQLSQVSVTKQNTKLRSPKVLANDTINSESLSSNSDYNTKLRMDRGKRRIDKTNRSTQGSVNSHNTRSSTVTNSDSFSPHSDSKNNLSMVKRNKRKRALSISSQLSNESITNDSKRIRNSKMLPINLKNYDSSSTNEGNSPKEVKNKKSTNKNDNLLSIIYNNENINAKNKQRHSKRNIKSSSQTSSSSSKSIISNSQDSTISNKSIISDSQESNSSSSQKVTALKENNYSKIKRRETPLKDSLKNLIAHINPQSSRTMKLRKRNKRKIF